MSLRILFHCIIIRIGKGYDRTFPGGRTAGLNLQYYWNFIEIVETGSFSAASRKLKVAQPALSNQVKALEERYETRLLQRGSGTHGLELTETGKILYEAAKAMRVAEEKAAGEIAELHGAVDDTLRIGVMNPPGNRYLMIPLHHYSERYPDVKIMVREAVEEDIIRMLRAGIIDGALLGSLRELPEDMEIVTTCEDDVQAFYLPGAFFAGNDGGSVSLQELCKFPLCVAQSDLKTVRAGFRAQNCAFMPKYVGTNTHACLLWALEGKAVALVPRLAVDAGGQTTLLRKTIHDHALGGNEVAFVARKKMYRSRFLNRFIEVLIELKTRAVSNTPQSKEGDLQA